MSRKKFELDTKAFSDEVINAGFMVNFVGEQCASIAQTAGDGYDYSFQRGAKRALGMVWAESIEAQKDDNENNTLLKAAYPLQVVEK